MAFLNQKKMYLEKIDLSRKSSIDEHILELVKFINNLESYVTTSSCSGRIIVFTNSEQKKKGCNWLFVSHGIVSSENIEEALNSHSGSAVLKFEPFVMHVRCSSIESAQKLHTCSLESGFRNSGLTMNKKGGIVLAIRNTLSLEVPLSCDGKSLVSSEYITHVVSICNEKMEENWCRTEKLFTSLKTLSCKVNENCTNSEKNSSMLEEDFSEEAQSSEYCKESSCNTSDDFVVS
ncbi:tRNA wybutosine-synthesizing protein 3 homolog [Parasteatoda tepidariorum]|uniref:tRNA wybutosine-synthesizing protein 3 homolog n=1 Tax=Parasteatoda tepidariorum TaxID=114398 RepID=UPI001C71FF0F|nr:tRNA wybutosine-synthesizing protein 3 homolog [Parasteatoda tepidariorum]